MYVYVHVSSNMPTEHPFYLLYIICTVPIIVWALHALAGMCARGPLHAEQHADWRLRFRLSMQSVPNADKYETRTLVVVIEVVLWVRDKIICACTSKCCQEKTACSHSCIYSILVVALEVLL